MEAALRSRRFQPFGVLILVHVEDGVEGHQNCRNRKREPCLNPCSRGRWCGSRKSGKRAFIPAPRLNPCSRGRWCGSISLSRQSLMGKSVLILVHVEDGVEVRVLRSERTGALYVLILVHVEDGVEAASGYLYPHRRFWRLNPCSRGRWCGRALRTTGCISAQCCAMATLLPRKSVPTNTFAKVRKKNQRCKYH